MRLSPARIALVLIAVLCPFAYGQNTESKNAPTNEAREGMPPRTTPGDYQAHAQAGAVTIAAEFIGHAIPRAEGPLSTDDYVVVETGFFGPPGARLTLSVDDFSLRINGKKTLAGQPYGMVVSSVKDPAWGPPVPPESKSKTSIGTGGQSDANAPPPVVHVPIELQRAMAQHVHKFSLPEGDRALPEAGLIYFQYRGKAQKIRSIKLIYSGPAGKATLALQP
jgi:hypothetical protein